MAGTSCQSPAITRLRASMKSSTAALHPSEPLRKRDDAEGVRILWKTKEEMNAIAREGFGMLGNGKEHRTKK